MSLLTAEIDRIGAGLPLVYLLLFFGATALMIWRTETMMERGLEGTALGTLIMPYSSGLGNLIFVFVVASQRHGGREVVVNCLVNNVTNLTLLIGIPAAIWGLTVVDGKRRRIREKRAQQVNRLSLLLTALAVIFFSGTTWALGRDGSLDLGDGIVLILIFLFWQVFHVYDVMKTNVAERRGISPLLAVDVTLLLVGAFLLVTSLDWLVAWLSGLQVPWLGEDQLGWMTGWLMVLPNATLAVYYGWKRQADVVYASQIGDGHICIPLCLGVAAVLHPIRLPGVFAPGMILLIGAAVLHFGVLATFGRVPRWLGIALILAYGVFLYRGALS
ncbi:MAG: sodium:calcium symporter [Opitutaceae bacterium]